MGLINKVDMVCLSPHRRQTYHINLVDQTHITRMGSHIFRDIWDKKVLVSRDLKIGRFAVEKWFLLLF